MFNCVGGVMKYALRIGCTINPNLAFLQQQRAIKDRPLRFFRYFAYALGAVREGDAMSP